MPFASSDHLIPTAARLGVDIGGTFTDLAFASKEVFAVGKTLTTPGEEQNGVLAAIEQAGVDLARPGLVFAHGTTLIINSYLERRGARTALVTTAGFGDVHEMGRGNRPEIFNPFYRRNSALVPTELRFEITERVHSNGDVIRRPSVGELSDLVRKLKRKGVESVAVGFLNSYVQSENEEFVGKYISDHLPGVPVTISSDISRQWREYERFTTAAANAFVRPLVAEYLDKLLASVGAKQFAGEFVVLDSAGGALDPNTARSYPIRLVESGPVAGVIGARDLGISLGIDQLVSFDMGGTTAKCCLIEGGSYASTELYWVGGYSVGFPVAVPTVEVTEVGAGGGSIAWKDDDGRLHVGPRSAGANPGPACYGLGGLQATVTDANLVAGRLPEHHFAETISLDLDAGRRSIERLAASLQLSPVRVALGIIRLANLSMAAAVRRQTLERGRDPREFTMVAFGGAGPMHACEVAREVGIRKVVIPLRPGHFSAIGMLKTNVRLEHREAFPAALATIDVGRLQEAISRAGELVRRRVESGSSDQVELTYSLAIRYHGQEHSLLVPQPRPGLTVTSHALVELRALFEEEYVRRYGHLDELSSLEIVFFQVLAERRLPNVSAAQFSATAERQIEESVVCFEDYPDGIRADVIAREALAVGATILGPCILYEDGCTSVIPPGARAEVAKDGSLIVDVGQHDD